MDKKSKNKKQFFDILNHMDTRAAFVDLVASMCASINLKYGCRTQLVAPAGALLLTQDIVATYNAAANIHYINSYQGSIRSRKKRDRKGYLRRFKKQLYNAVDFRYLHGHAVAVLPYDEVIDALNTFFSLLGLNI